MKTNRTETLVSFVTVALIGIVYLRFLNHRYFVDGLNVAWILETQDNLFIHPHHPLFPLLLQVLYKLIGGDSSGVDSLGLIVIWSVLSGVLAIWGLQHILKTIGLPRPAIIFSILLFAFSNATWYFSSTPNQYTTALAMHVFTVIYLVPVITGRAVLTPRTAIIIGILTGLSILSHQINALLLIPVFYIGWTSGDRLKNTGISIGSVVLIAVLFTIFSGIAFEGVRSFSDFISWQKSYVVRSMYWAEGPVDSITRSFRGMIELHLAHVFHLEGLFGNWNDSSGSSTWYWRLILRFAQAYTLIFIGYETVKSLLEWIKARPRLSIQTLGLLCAMPFFIFSFFFTPDSTNYRLFYLPGFILFLAPALVRHFQLEKFEIKKAWPLVLLIIALFTTNFSVKFLPESDPSKNPFIAEAGLIAEWVGTGDLLVYSGAGEDYFRMHYMRYFTLADVAILPELIDAIRNNPEDLVADIKNRDVNGNVIYIHEDALYSVEDVEWLNELYGTDIGQKEFLEFISEYIVVIRSIEVNEKDYILVAPYVEDVEEEFPGEEFEAEAESN